jgi:hypothetical protein
LDHPQVSGSRRISPTASPIEPANRHDADESAGACATARDLKAERNHRKAGAADAAQACPTCFACKKQIVDNQWFCRLTPTPKTALHQEAKILLCSPLCALGYFGESEPTGSGPEPRYDRFDHAPYVPGVGQPSESFDAVGAETSRED